MNTNMSKQQILNIVRNTVRGVYKHQEDLKDEDYGCIGFKKWSEEFIASSLGNIFKELSTGDGKCAIKSIIEDINIGRKTVMNMHLDYERKLIMSHEVIDTGIEDICRYIMKKSIVKNENAYLQLLQFVLDTGIEKEDRTGTGTISHFGAQMRFDLQDGFPLITTKKVHMKSIVHELLWFLSGDTHVKYLQDNNVKIWDAWATEAKCAEFMRSEGDLGPIYGHQWRNFNATLPNIGEKTNTKISNNDGFDQISHVIEQIKTNPDSRRLIVSAWNPCEADIVHLPPCHTMFQFFVANDKLSCQLYQRSADLFLGVPFNIASYALLTHMVAQVCNLEVGEFIWTGGDCHIYKNHINQVKEQLNRVPLELPKLELDKSVNDIFDFKFEHIKVIDYFPYKSIKAPVAI